jgi:hypothetical protein
MTEIEHADDDEPAVDSTDPLERRALTLVTCAASP